MQVPVLDVIMSPSDGSHVSFQTGHNIVSLTFTSDISLVYAEVRITKGTIGYDIGVGNLATYTAGSIPASTPYTLSFAVNSTSFSEGDGLYTVSLYVKNSIDGSWNEYHFFITVDGNDFITSESENLKVVTDQEIPS